MTEEPGYGPDQILRGMSLGRRTGYAAVGLAGFCGASLLGLLWMTEPGGLPWRTRASFAVLIAVGLAWTVFAVVALARRPLFAVDRVIGAGLAVGFSTALLIGMMVLARTRTGATGWVAAGGLGLPMTVAAGVLLRRAVVHRARLQARRRELEAGGPRGPDATGGRGGVPGPGG